MKKTILTFAITIAISTISFAQIKVTPGGDFAIGQNFITNNWFKTEIKGDHKVALGISTTNEDPYGWAAVSKANNPSTKHWIVSLNGYNNHNFWVESSGIIAYQRTNRLSDGTKKMNFRPIENSAEVLTQLKTYYFDYKPGFNGTEIYDSIHYINQPGFIAQEIQEIFPQLVSSSENGILGVDYEALIPILVQSHKEQNQRIDNLENALLICCADSHTAPQIDQKNGEGIPKEQKNTLGLNDKTNSLFTDSYKIVPNPNKGIFDVVTKNNIATNQILITNLNGEIINNISLTSKSANSVQIQIEGHASGVYYVHILEQGSIIESKKVVVLN